MPCGTKIVNAVLLVAATTLSTAPVATATPQPNMVHRKYSEAVKEFKDAGLSVRIASKIGDRTAVDDCIVVHQHLRSEAQMTKKKVARTTMLVSLTCFAGVATVTAPGQSAATPTSTSAPTSKADKPAGRGR